MYAGLGLTGMVAGRSIAVGNRRLMAQVQEDSPSVLDSEAEWANKGTSHILPFECHCRVSANPKPTTVTTQFC